MSCKKSIILSVLVFLSLVFAFSASAQLSLRGPSQITVESCTQATITLTLFNSDPTAHRAAFSFDESRASNWVLLVPRSTIIEPQQSQELILYVNVPCQIEGTFKTDLTVTGTAKPITLPITIKAVRNTNTIVTGPTQVNSCPCTPQHLSYILTNTGSYPESYEITPEKNAQYITVAPQKVVLFPNQQTIINAYVATPCEIFGEKELSFNVRSMQGGFAAKVPITYTIDACYDYALSIPASIEACLDGTTQVNVLIKNLAHFSNTFTVSSSPSWTTVETPSVSLLPNQNGIVSFLIEPRSQGLFAQRVDNYTVQLNAISTLGKAKITQDVPISVEQCYQLSIEKQDPQDTTTFCVGDTSQENQTIPLVVANTGSKNITALLGITGPEFLSISPANVNISAFTGKVIHLKYDPQNETTVIPGSYPVTIQAQMENNVLINAQTKFTIKTVDVQGCYQITVEPLQFTLSPEEQNYTLIISNNGVRNATYDLSLEGLEDVLALEQNAVSLSPGQSAPVYIGANSSLLPEGSYVVNFTAQIPQVAYKHELVFKQQSSVPWIFVLIALLVLLLLLLVLVLVTVRATKKKYESKEKSEEKPKIVTTQKKSKKEIKPTPKKKKERKQKKRKSDKKFNWWPLILILLLLLVIAGVIWFVRSYTPIQEQPMNQTTNITENQSGGGIINISNPVNVTEQNTSVPPEQEEISPPTQPLTERQISILLLDEFINNLPENMQESFVYQRVFEGKTLTINLSKYFVDPDGDALFFTAVNPPNVSITFENETAFISADPQFIGVRYTIFYARDQNNLTTQSPVVNIIVLPENLTDEVQAIRQELGGTTLTVDELFAQYYPDVFSSAEQKQNEQKARTYSAILAVFLVIAIIVSVRFAARPKKPKKKQDKIEPQPVE